MQETVVAFMKENYLLWEFTEEPQTELITVLQRVKQDMERSPFAYRFVRSEEFIRGHEGLGLTLLEHVNRGHLIGNQAFLRPTSYRASTTIEVLFNDKKNFAVTSHSLGFYENHFVINAGE